jgi:hypothetical protein
MPRSLGRPGIVEAQRDQFGEICFAHTHHRVCSTPVAAPLGPRAVFPRISCMPVDGIAGRLLTTEDRNYDRWSAHSRALGFLLPVSPDARGVNFNSTIEKQPDQGTNGRIVPPRSRCRL